jgi:hypothetical protein
VQVLPEGEEKKSGLCPICDAKVDIDAQRCPECKADLSVFGVKTGEEELHDVKIPEDASLERLLGEIGEKDEKKEHELFEEIMAAVDKTHSLPGEEDSLEMPPEEEAPTEAAEGGAVMFECPLCNTLVSEDAKSCPGCGAIFAAGGEEEAAKGMEEGRVEEIPAPPEEPPPIVEEEAPAPEPEIEEILPSKPKKKFKLGIKRKEGVLARVTEEKPAGAVAEDVKALQRELATSVSDVKPLLADARKMGINVLEGRKLIDQAITAGKQRDFEGAITLVKDSKKIIENTISEHIIDSIQATQSKIVTLSHAGGEVSELENMLAKVQLLLNERKYIKAVELAKKTAEEAEKVEEDLKATMKVEEEGEEAGKGVADQVRNLVELIKTGEEVKVNVKGAKALLTQARVAIKRNDLITAETLLTEAKDDFLRELPRQLTDIISNSKPVLYKAKMQGVDIRPSIKHLKEASASLKLNNYLDALEAIKRYKTEMTQYMD